jgi:hypothetical protein
VSLPLPFSGVMSRQAQGFLPRIARMDTKEGPLARIDLGHTKLVFSSWDAIWVM